MRFKFRVFTQNFQRIVLFFYLLREPQGIIACCNPVPPMVRQQVNELNLLVQQAREMPLLKVRKDGCQQRRFTVFCLRYFSVCVVTSLVSEGASIN